MATTNTQSTDKSTLSTLDYLTQNLSNFSLDEVLTEPAKSDESLKNFEKHVKPRKLFPNDPTQGINGYKEMRVVLWQTAAGMKPPSGGFRGNYATLHSLTGHGHKTMQLVWAFEPDISDAIAELKEHKKYDKSTWEEGKVDMLNTKLETIRVKYWKFTDVHGVKCVALDADTMIETLPNELQQADAATYIKTDSIPARSVPYINWVVQEMTNFEPTHIIFNDALASKVTSEMPICKDKTRRVEVIHSAEQFPLGPFAGGVPGSSKTTAELPLWHTLDGAVSVSLALQAYVKNHGLETTYIPNHAWSYKDRNTGDWPRVRSNFAKQTVVMVNPTYVKGYNIFLGMAKENRKRASLNRFNFKPDEQLPTYRFIAYLGWGAKPHIVDELRTAGVEIRAATIDMEPAFDDMGVLIMPSLWFEAWGIVATEAQLRGIPVIASEVGGIPEAKRYVGPLIPINAINGNNRKEDGSYIIPEQDVTPWMVKLDEIMTTEARYSAASDASFFTVRQWCRKFDIREMERFLLAMMK